MLDQELIVKSVVDSTSEVFEMMLGMKARFTGTLNDTDQNEPGLVSLIGITGDWAGSGIFCCTPAFARTIAGNMLGGMLESGEGTTSEEVMDVVAELTNMVVGNIKNNLEPVTGPLAISVPTVIHGRNFRFRNMAGLPGSSLGFSAGSNKFEIRVALAPAPERPSVLRSKIPVLGLTTA